MRIADLIRKYHQDKTAVFINGMGVGKIAKIEEDFISFEMVIGEDKKLSREITHIPIDRIDSISEGKKEVPKSEEDKSIDNALEGL
jgi:hypothetical protein